MTLFPFLSLKEVDLMLKKEKMIQLTFFLPALTLLLFFLVLPFIMAFVLSFTNQRLIPGPVPTIFVGWTNYLRMFRDSQFYVGLKNNLLFVVFVVPIQGIFALALAVLVNTRLRMVSVFRTIFFMPTVTTMVVVSVIWSFLYHPQGLINGFLSLIGQVESIDFLRNQHWALPSIMFMSIWQGVGFQMLIFLAGLQEIPLSLYEAADIDGANSWKKFLYVTLPLLRNTSIFVLISTTILAFRLFDQVMIMTQGGPQNTTYTMMLHIYNTAFARHNIGYGSALTVVFFLIVLLVSIFQRILIKEER